VKKISRLTIPGALVLMVVFLVMISPLGRVIFASGSNLYTKIQILQDVIQIINSNYVDNPDWDKIINGTIAGMLETLDPHSVYIAKNQLSDIQEQFDGKFQGIGIEFDILDGYITVISPIAGSPSDRVGLQVGDKLIRIDGESAHRITREDVFKRLRGPKGSAVVVTIRREGSADFDVTIIRDDIPLYSVLAKCMLDDKTGYIYLSRFSGTTADEMERALTELESRGMQQLIFDLRNNSGGYLEAAVAVADKFIAGRQKIVYTQGRIRGANEEFYSGDKDRHPQFPLIVLINRGSASASEIVSGAVQDLDRGIIIGETSFGKGLVQRQYPLRDGAAVRVTVARYYTPSGRLIQRPYDEDADQYYDTFSEEYRDSILAEHDKQKPRPEYHTNSGRVVLGGGGITPDHYVPFRLELTRDTFSLLRHPSRILFDYSHKYASKNPKWRDNEERFMAKFEVTDKMVDEFLNDAKAKEIQVNYDNLRKDTDYLKTVLKAEIAKDYWGYDQYYKVIRLRDNQVQEAMNYFNEASRMVAQTK